MIKLIADKIKFGQFQTWIKYSELDKHCYFA